MEEQPCSGPSNRGQSQNMQALEAEVERNLKNVRHKIVVLSGKGGVGKSTVAANLAVHMSCMDKKVGLLDVDLHGPSIPRILNLDRRAVTASQGAIAPLETATGLKVMSLGMFMRDGDDAIIWRGPRKFHMIHQFLADVRWGQLDFLIVDCPPGTGDEPLAVVQLLGKATAAVIVTTAQQVALSDVRKSISFCRELNLPILGVLENMSGFVCPKCSERTDIFKSGGGQDMAVQMGTPFLGRIPIDPEIVSACDSGRPYISISTDMPAANSFKDAVKSIIANKSTDKTHDQNEGDSMLRIAVPLVEGKLSRHFGHCQSFALVDADAETKSITGAREVEPPAHQPGVLPQWLAEQRANVIIAGGMGSRAQGLFAQHGIDVIVGAPAESAETLVSLYLNDSLQSGANVCDH